MLIPDALTSVGISIAAASFFVSSAWTLVQLFGRRGISIDEITEKITDAVEKAMHNHRMDLKDELHGIDLIIKDHDKTLKRLEQIEPILQQIARVQ